MLGAGVLPVFKSKLPRVIFNRLLDINQSEVPRFVRYLNNPASGPNEVLKMMVVRADTMNAFLEPCFQR